MQSLQKVERSSTSGKCCESKKAALRSLEMICYTGQSGCNLYRNGVATQVAKEIAPCNTNLNNVYVSAIIALLSKIEQKMFGSEQSRISTMIFIHLEMVLFEFNRVISTM